MKKKKTSKEGLKLYLVIGLVVSLLSLLVSIPVGWLMALSLILLSGNTIFTVIGIIVWIPIALIINGWIIIQVVKWRGYRKYK
jgi:hypothetical protein